MKTAFGLTALVAVVLGVVGWVMNIFKMIAVIPEGFTPELLIRALGIPVAIIGAVYGWF